MDFFVWRAVKQKMYEQPVNNIETLKLRVMQACNKIISVQCQSATSSVIDRCNACLRTDGNHFEQHIHYNNYNYF
ncbi:hypothetical protein WN51_13126 [Melipona quadrifasciata]|uniref:Uncharacterized protein n=1 Tax=Melipona quadrifasciata TaxID=166423 RepID=A0A0N0BGK5_9HYME|nr:hypothetical protein WN51_13126 [Melipona quadrifasciata]